MINGSKSYILALFLALTSFLFIADSAFSKDLLKRRSEFVTNNSNSTNIDGNKKYLEKKEGDLAKWGSYIETAAFAKTSGRNIAMADLFLKIKEFDSSLLFFDIRKQFDNRDSDEYNVGIGYRSIINNNILGVYAYYDKRNSSNNNSFEQITIGIESLGEKWDFRANLYLPEGDEKQTTSNAYVENHNLKVSYGYEKALDGYDFEVGRRIPVGDTIAYLGGYYFEEDRQSGFVYEEISGVRARIETSFFDDSLTFGAEIVDDKSNDIDQTAYVKFKIPFGKKEKKKNLSFIETRMMEPIVRDIDVITNEHKEIADAYYISSTGQKISSIDVLNLSNIDIDNEIESKADNSLLILHGSGTINNVITPNAGQVLLAGNSSINISYSDSRGNTSLVSYKPNLSEANISAPNTMDVFDVYKNNVILKGLNINNGRNAVVINNKLATNVSLSNLNINSSVTGVRVKGYNDTSSAILNMDNLNINNTTNGIYLDSVKNDNISLNNVDMSNINSDGFTLQNSSDSQFNFNNYLYSGSGSRIKTVNVSSGPTL